MGNPRLNNRETIVCSIRNLVVVLTILLFAFSRFTFEVWAQENPTPVRQKVLLEIQRAQAIKLPSRSSGTLRNGQLENAAELPQPDGIGYFIFHSDRDTNFGADRMVFGLLQLGLTIHERLGPEAHNRILINEISDRDGGKQTRHINHQMGLDVDLGFYATDLKGTPVQARWLEFDKQGVSPKKPLRFDVQRNWALVESMLKNETFGEIRAILIADWLKQMLLTHAKESAKNMDKDEAEQIAQLIRRAQVLMRQPESSPHDTHFHLSLKMKS